MCNGSSAPSGQWFRPPRFRTRTCSARIGPPRPDDDESILVPRSDNGPDMTVIGTRQFIVLMASTEQNGRPGVPAPGVDDQAHVDSPESA
jgi:hypothetical protein